MNGKQAKLLRDYSKRIAQEQDLDERRVYQHLKKEWGLVSRTKRASVNEYLSFVVVSPSYLKK